MTSSLAPPRRVEPAERLEVPCLMDLLDGLPDPRDPRGRRHPLATVLTGVLTAMATGATSPTAIAEWIADPSNTAIENLRGELHKRPSESTIRRVLREVDADVLDQLFGAWMWTTTATLAGRRVIAVDGKTVRGAREHHPGATPAPHLVSALDHATATVLGQVQTPAKSNEIPAVRTLLDQFDLDGALVTVDALHTNPATAEHIVSAGGAYLMTIKANQPGLLSWAKAKRWSRLPVSRATKFGHGRRITRGVKVLQVTAVDAGLPHAAQLMQVRRTRTVYTAGGSTTNPRTPKKTVEVVYLLCSLGHLDAPAQKLMAWAQGHWGIENRLHWVRDVVFGEDGSRVRTGAGCRVMASMRSAVISLLRLAGFDSISRAVRWMGRDPGRATALVRDAHTRLRQGPGGAPWERRTEGSYRCRIPI